MGSTKDGDAAMGLARCRCGAEIDPAQRRCESCGQRQPLRPGHVIADRYRLLERLGSGGMGTVFRARDLKLDVDVALKVVALGDRRSAERFKSEVRLARSIKHPNVCAVFEYGEESDGHLQYATMELVEGQNLRQLREGAVLDYRRAADLVRQAAEGLHAIHSAGLVHRDIKTANLMVTPEGSLRIVDFGIARAVEPRPGEAGHTVPGFIVGSPEYMSPEQARQLPLDPRSDLYSLGVVLYELLIGSVPFRGDSVIEVLNQHISAPPPLDTPTAELIPGELRPLLRRLLAKQPDDRPADAAELAGQLREILPRLSGTELVPVPAPHPPPSPWRARAWRLALVALTIAIALLASLCPRPPAENDDSPTTTSGASSTSTTNTTVPPDTLGSRASTPTATPPTTSTSTTSTVPTTTTTTTTTATTTTTTTTSTTTTTTSTTIRPPPPEKVAPTATPQTETCATVVPTCPESQCPDPPYPGQCQRLGMEGSVTVELSVDETGRVTGMRVVEKEGDDCPAFVSAIERAIREWRFDVPVVDGTACATVYTTTLSFEMPD